MRSASRARHYATNMTKQASLPIWVERADPQDGRIYSALDMQMYGVLKPDPTLYRYVFVVWIPYTSAFRVGAVEGKVISHQPAPV